MTLPSPVVGSHFDSQRNFDAVENVLKPFREQVRFGSGTPENVVTAPIGTIYLRTDGGSATTLYVKEGGGTGNTGWVPAGTAVGVGTHNLLSATHPDTAASSVTRGDLIVGNSTPAWDDLPVGAAGTVLSSDGTDVSWQTPGATYTDENAQDAVLGTLVGLDSSTWDLQYNDAAGTWTAAVIPGGIDHGALADLTADDHQQYAILSSRAGGQRLYGGDVTGGDLELYSNSFDPASHLVTIYPRLNLPIATGTSPMQVSSTTVVSNLNVDMVDGSHAAAFQPVDTDLSEIAALANVRGDLIYTNSGPNWARLAVGTTGQYLGTDGTDVSWRAQSTLDHGSIGGLADDDHSIYALLAGRSGGQEIIGGTGSGDDLTLSTTSNSTKGQFHFRDGQTTPGAVNLRIDGTTWTGTGAGGWMELATAFTIANGATFRALDMRAAVNYPATAAAGTTLAQVFRLSSTFTISGTTAAAPVVGFQYSPSFVPASAIAATGVSLRGYSFQAATNSVALLSGATMAIADVTGLYFVPGNLRTGYTITDYHPILSGTPTGAAATFTNVYGLAKIEDLSSITGGTIKCLLRNPNTDMAIETAGAGVFGAAAARTNASTGLEVQSTTLAFLLPRMTTAQANAMTKVAGMVVYDTTLGKSVTWDGAAWQVHW